MLFEVGPGFTAFAMDVQWVQNQLRTKAILLSLSCPDVYLDSAHWSLSFCQHYTALVTVDLSKSKITSMSPPKFFPSKIVLVILGSLQFHVSFSITLLISILTKPHRILTRQCTGSVCPCGEKYLNNFEPSDSWEQYISGYLQIFFDFTKQYFVIFSE